MTDPSASTVASAWVATQLGERVRLAVAALELEHRDLTRRLNDLRAEEVDVQARRAKVRIALHSLREVVGEELSGPTPEDDPPSIKEDAESIEQPDELLDEDLDDGDSAESDGPQRIRSTELVARVVNDLGRPVHRLAVLDEFQRRDLIPSSWQNPGKAVGTALSRAAEQGLLQRSARRGYYEPASPTSSETLSDAAVAPSSEPRPGE